MLAKLLTSKGNRFSSEKVIFDGQMQLRNLFEQSEPNLNLFTYGFLQSVDIKVSTNPKGPV